MVIGTVPLALRVDWTELTPMLWTLLRWSTIVSAFVGWLVWGWVNAVRGVGRTAPLMYLMPPVAGLVAWAVTGESYTGIKLAGAALALAGVALAQFAGSPRDPVREAVAPVD